MWHPRRPVASDTMHEATASIMAAPGKTHRRRRPMCLGGRRASKVPFRNQEWRDAAPTVRQPSTTGILPIRACHSFGPVLWTEVPCESTATVTGMSFTSNS